MSIENLVSLLFREFFFQKNLYVFKAEATDADGLSGYATVRIFIGDVNDNPPTFKQQLYTVEVPENTEIGTTIIQLEPDDADLGKN